MPSKEATEPSAALRLLHLLVLVMLLLLVMLLVLVVMLLVLVVMSLVLVMLLLPGFVGETVKSIVSECRSCFIKCCFRRDCVQYMTRMPHTNHISRAKSTDELAVTTKPIVT
jgi:hypothetical protein